MDWSLVWEALPLIWSSLRLVNQCEPVGPSPYLAEGYMNLGVLAGIAPLPRLSIWPSNCSAKL